MSQVAAFVLEAQISLSDGCDPAAVTTELCGHWEHSGPCRWPHNNAIDAGPDPARFRTVFVADEAEEMLIRRRIESALRGAAEWRLASVGARALAETERPLAGRLVAGPRASGELR